MSDDQDPACRRQRRQPPPEYVGALINLETPTRVSVYFLTQAFTFERVSEKFQILTPRIGNAELKSPAFGAFQARLQECFDRIQIIFVPSSPVAAR